MKTIFYLAFGLLLASCGRTSEKDEQASRLKRQKYAIDSAINAESLLIFIKVKDKPGLIPAEKGRNLKNVEAAYNVFKDESGKVAYIAEMPFSPKDDWFISYKNYFNKDGKLIAFQRLNNFFGSECAPGAAMEDLTRLYDQNFSIVDSVYTLTDTKKNKLEKDKCKFPYNFPYTVSKTLNEYMKLRGISEF